MKTIKTKRKIIMNYQWFLEKMGKKMMEKSRKKSCEWLKTDDKF